jgi:hypothetical protein
MRLVRGFCWLFGCWQHFGLCRHCKAVQGARKYYVGPVWTRISEPKQFVCWREPIPGKTDEHLGRLPERSRATV